jgi:crossover junction endodeoxyribonuclease RuvC
MLYLGIDPGKSGAVALITREQEILLLQDWPDGEVAASKIIWDCWDIADMQNEDLYGTPKILGAIEAQAARPAFGGPICGSCKRPLNAMQGIVSTFTFGTNYGIWKGILAACGIPFLEPRPSEWMKGLFKKVDGKEANMATASRIFPDAKIYGPKGGKKDGRADALLIAYWRSKQ